MVSRNLLKNIKDTTININRIIAIFSTFSIAMIIEPIDKIKWLVIIDQNLLFNNNND